MELWNLKNLEAPPITSSELRGKEINLRMLHNVLTEGISFFQNQQHLCLEATVLSRLIYRMKMKFRSSKDFKILEKLNHSLLNYLQIDISKILTTFHLLVPQQCTSNETYLPSKNMLHYVLVRMQGLGKLFWSILETCKIASRMQQQRMRLGHFWRIAIIVFGIVSRIFIITKNMIKFTCELYSNLEAFLKKLTNPGPRWLPNNYIVPQSLTDWLQIDWLDLDTTVIEIPDEEPNIISYFNLIDSDDDDDNDILISDEYIIVNDDPSIASSDDDVIYEGKVEEDKNLQGFQDDVDVGEIVDLEAPSPPRKRKLLNRANFFNENSESNNDSVVFVGEIVADNSDNVGIVKVTPNSIENKSLKRKKLPHNRSDVKDAKMSKAKKRKLQNKNLPLDSSVHFKNETVSKRKRRQIKKKIVTLGYSESFQEVTPKGKKMKVKKKNVTLESPGTVKDSARKKTKFNRNSLVVSQGDDASGTGTKKSKKKKKKKMTENRIENLKLTFKQKRKNRKRKSKGMVFKTQNRADFTT